ncbi:MAG: TolC family protein [Methylobacillus sp.]|jgi:outer membrane protein TolC|nr:TolC family protein [Methylobacillus sp.]
MKFHLRIFLLRAAPALLLTAACVHAHAEEELEHLYPDSNLTLGSVLQATFERDPRQPLLQANMVGVEARDKHASALLPGAPAVDLNHQTDAIGSGRNLREWGATLEFPVWLPGQKSAREAVAREARGGLDASRTGLLLDAAGRLREAYWDVSMNRNAAELAGRRAQTALALEQDVERRQQAGELAKTDVMLAKNETLQAQAAQLRAEAELKHAEHRWWMLTGLKSIPVYGDEQQASEAQADDSHPLLAPSARRVALMQEERNLARVERRENPQVLLSARHDRGAFDDAFDNSVGLAVRIPLDAEVRSAPLMARAEMDLAQAMTEHEQRRLDLLAVMHEAEHNLEVTRQELVLVEEQNRLAQENLNLARKAFTLGETDLVALLRVQALAFEAERALQTRRIQLQWDIARYNQAAGVLP